MCASLFAFHFIKIVFYIYYFILMSGVEQYLSPILAFHTDRKCVAWQNCQINIFL